MGSRRHPQGTPLRLVRKKGDCNHCEAVEACLSAGLEEAIAQGFMELIEEIGPFQPGDPIFRRGEPFHSLYTLQNGHVKTEVETLEGRLQVTGFYLAGDLFGLDGVGSPARPSSAIALSECWCCRIPYDGLLELCHRDQQLMSRVLSTMGVRLQESEDEWNLLMNEPVDHRVIYFFQYMLERHNRIQGVKSNRFELTMSKQDIANFLGITAESLSRSLGRLREQGVITTQPKAVELNPSARDWQSL